jgi:hypothetical protein
MILYRGTPEPESLPKLRAFPVVFFAFDYVEVVDYATGGEQEPYGYVQEYSVPDNLHLLDLDEDTAIVEQFFGRSLTKAEYIDLLHYPSKEWVAFVKSMGFEGIIGNYVLLFHVAGARLIRRWRLRYNEEFRRYDAVLIHDAAGVAS